MKWSSTTTKAATGTRTWTTISSLLSSRARRKPTWWRFCVLSAARAGKTSHVPLHFRNETHPFSVRFPVAGGVPSRSQAGDRGDTEGQLRYFLAIGACRRRKGVPRKGRGYRLERSGGGDGLHHAAPACGCDDQSPRRCHCARADRPQDDGVGGGTCGARKCSSRHLRFGYRYGQIRCSNCYRQL